MKHNLITTRAATALCGLLAVFTLAADSGKAFAGPPEPVAIVLDGGFTLNIEGGTVTGGTLDGTFTATGGWEAAGIVTIDIRLEADTMHCDGLLIGADGTITIAMECKMVLTSPTSGGGPGRWVITHGTGAYANLHGTGSTTMDFDLATATASETLAGFAFFDHGR